MVADSWVGREAYYSSLTYIRCLNFESGLRDRAHNNYLPETIFSRPERLVRITHSRFDYLNIFVTIPKYVT